MPSLYIRRMMDVPVYCIIRDVRVCIDDFDKLFDLFGFCRNSSTSSAYRLILCIHLLVRMPVILSFWCIAAASGSIKNANSKGESGHPCLVPLWSVRFFRDLVVSHDCST